MSDEVKKFTEDVEAAKAEIYKLQQGNVDKVNALAQNGKAIDPSALANVKIDTFVETFLDEGAQLVYVRNLETRLRQILDEALKTVRQDALTEGVATNKGGLIIPR
jgi:hypothetical protein